VASAAACAGVTTISAYGQTIATRLLISTYFVPSNASNTTV